MVRLAFMHRILISLSGSSRRHLPPWYQGAGHARPDGHHQLGSEHGGQSGLVTGPVANPDAASSEPGLGSHKEQWEMGLETDTAVVSLGQELGPWTKCG